MKGRWKRVLLGLFGVVGCLVIAFVVYVEIEYDHVYDIALPDLEASTDPELIERGRYLVHGPAHCSNCHVASFDEMQRADSGEDLPLAGGAAFPMGPIGTITVKNLTPDEETGLGRYSDGQIFRMLRHAVRPDGTASIALFMPFQNMADEDHVAIVSYLRSMEPVRREVPDNEWSFMGKTMRVFAPPFQPVMNPTPPDHAPPEEPTADRGEYIARYVANCYACHTAHDMVTFERIGPEWGGGAEFEPLPYPGIDPSQWSRSPNLTTHETGIMGRYPTPEQWIARFRAGRTIENSPMHWGPFSRMSDTDLTALWEFFRSLAPVNNPVGAVLFNKD